MFSSESPCVIMLLIPASHVHRYPDICSGACEGPTAVARAAGIVPASDSSHAKWYGEHRHLVTDRRGVADVAVVLDLPLFFWRGFSSVAVHGNQPHVLALQNITALLDEAHVPYDLLFHGHKDFYDDHKHWQRLSSYRTLVLPRVEAVSDDHVAHIASFYRAGGHVVVLDDASGITDEEDSPRDVPAFDSLRRGGVTWVNSSVFQSFTHNNTATSRAVITQALKLDEDPLLLTNLSGVASTFMWLHGNGPMTSVQLANGDTHSSSTLTSNTSHTLSVRVGASQLTEEQEVLFYTWSLNESTSTPTPLPFTVNGSRIDVVVPPFERYGAVTIGARNEASLRALASKVRTRVKTWVDVVLLSMSST